MWWKRGRGGNGGSGGNDDSSGRRGRGGKGGHGGGKRGHGGEKGGRGGGKGGGGRDGGNGDCSGKRGRGGKGGHGGKGDGGEKGSHGGGSKSGGKGSHKQSYEDFIPEDAKSITIQDTGFIEPPEFRPTRTPGPHVAGKGDVSALGLFEEFFDDVAIDRVMQSTLSYAEQNKERKKGRYNLFKRKPLTRGVLMAFLGVLILLGIHGVRNYRKAWSEARAQVMIRLNDLMTCQRFELIGCFLHVITSEEEAAMASDPLRKIRPLQEHIKKKCLQFYQPCQYLSINERMVNSKA